MPTGVEEVALALAVAIEVGAAASAVSNDSAAQCGFAADLATGTCCDVFLPPELAEGGSAADGECKSYDASYESEPSAPRPVSGDRPQQSAAPPPLARVAPPSPTDLDAPSADSPSTADTIGEIVEDVKERVTHHPTYEIGPHMTLVLPSFGDWVLAPLMPMGTAPTIVFDTEGAMEEGLGLERSEDAPEMPLPFDEPAPETAADKVMATVQQATGTDQVIKRSTNLLKGAAMDPGDLSDEQNQERERVMARDGFLLAYELLLMLMNRGRKGKPMSHSVPPHRPLPSLGPSGPPRRPIDPRPPSTTTSTRNAIEGQAAKKNEPANDPSIKRLPSEGKSERLGEAPNKTFKGVFEGMEVTVKADSKNNNGVQSMKVEVKDVTKLPKGDKNEHAAWRRVLRDMGLIDKGSDAGHGIGRAIADLRATFNFFNEAPGANRGTKNMVAEKAVRDFLERTDRKTPAKLIYESEFRDAAGNPVVTKCRITLITEDGVKQVDITVDMATNTHVNHLTTLP